MPKNPSPLDKRRELPADGVPLSQVPNEPQEQDVQSSSHDMQPLNDAAHALARYIAKAVHELHPGPIAPAVTSLEQECRYFHALLLRGAHRVVPLNGDVLCRLIQDLRDAEAKLPK